MQKILKIKMSRLRKLNEMNVSTPIMISGMLCGVIEPNPVVEIVVTTYIILYTDKEPFLGST